MFGRRRLLCFLALPLLAQAASEPVLDFIHLTDTHVVELRGVAPALALGRGHLLDAAERLASFLEVFSAPEAGPYRPAFFLITGDLVDAFGYDGEKDGRVGGQLEAFHDSLGASRVPVYLALGNHDCMKVTASGASPAAEARIAWMAAEPCFHHGTYYAFERRVGGVTYSFLVLDNGDEVGQQQLEWLRRQARPDRLLIIALHAPLGNDAASCSLAAALAHARVALVLAGHTHGNLIRPIALGTGGAVEARTAAFAAGSANWRRVRLYGDRVAICASGEPDRVEKVVRTPPQP